MRAYSQYLPLALSLVLFGVFSHYFYGQIGDDSYIYFRYVERALNGHWGSWTDHIPAVEGYSSVLWTAWLVFLGKLGVGIETAARVSGLVFAFAGLLSTYQLARVLKAPVVAAGTASLLFSMVAGLYYWATAGLETSLYLLIFIQAVISLIRLRHYIFWLGLIGLARPEGPILLIALLIATRMTHRDKVPYWHLALALAPTIAWVMMRWQLYQQPLPNTFYAKATGNMGPQLVRGLVYGFFCLVPLLASWAIWFREKRQDIMIALGATTMLLGIIVGGGGDWMIHARLLVPVIAVLLAAWVGLLSDSLWRNMVLIVALLPMELMVVFPTQWQQAFSGQQMPAVYKMEGTMTEASIALADKIEERFGDQQRLIAVNHAGALPYALASHSFIDMVGLNDPHIAQSEGQMHGKHDADYVLAQKPDLIVLNSRTKPGTDGLTYHPGYWVGETALVDHPEFAKNYHWVPDLTAHWQWAMHAPYAWFYDAPEESWILVYARNGIDNNKQH